MSAHGDDPKVSGKTADERIAEQKAAEEALRARLAELQYDGPHECGGFDPVSMLFGGGPTRYCICLRCGAMVRLDDGMEDEGRLIERSIRLHGEFHDALAGDGA